MGGPGAKNSGLRRALGVTGFGLTSVGALSNAHATTDGATLPADQPVTDIVVTGKRTKLDALSETILNTPQSIDVVPEAIIREQGLARLQDALRNVPGITLNAGEGGTHGDLVNLRGFSAGDDFFLDGLRDTGLYDRDAFDYDSLEVLKGPASTLFGRGSTGGVVNQVTKSPHASDFISATAQIGVEGDARGTIDGNHALSDSAALRLDAMVNRDRVVGRPYVKNERWGLAPSLALGLGTPTLFTLKYVHQHEDNLPDYGIPFLFGKPAPVPRNSFYGLPADDEWKTDVDVVTGRLEHTFNDALSFADNARYGHYTFDSRQTAPVYGNANCYGVAAYAGAPVCATIVNPVPVTMFNPLYPVAGTPLDHIFVERDRPSSTGTITTKMNSATLAAKFSTGSLAHTLIASLEIDSEDAALVRFANQDTAILPTPLLDPDPNEIFPGHQTNIRQLPTTSTMTIAAALVDTISFGQHWELIGAARFDHFTARFHQPLGTPSHFKHSDDIVSPRAAIIYKPTPDSSLYLSYGTSFDPSAENLSLSASNQALGPERDRTFEAGAKVQLRADTLALTAAAFDTEMTNARITDPFTPLLQTLAGNLAVNGVEVELEGRLAPQWEITAGYTYLQPEAKGLIAPGVKGPIPNIARNQANLWTTYELPLGIEIGTGLNYVGTRSAGTDTLTDPRSLIIATVPSYVTWDAMAAFEINDHVRVQINGQNLTDEYYFASSYFTRPGENHVIPGAGRTVLASLSVSY